MPKLVIADVNNTDKTVIDKAMKDNTPLSSTDAQFIIEKLTTDGQVEINIETGFNLMGLLSALHTAKVKVNFKE
ncbi:hypothetical protein [uncultured Shewanella sp.]|uniref:hypothetical protein n=1 Tax=uncultured Shewanella sp. TaxID=173975 RepID=UPI002631B9EE|nr:hypothetical protein [uncultured Shewanella sp.]